MLPFAAPFPGPFGVLSWFRIAPCAPPDAFCVNSPGAVAAVVN